MNAYPYGSTPNDQACNGSAHGVGTSVVVASVPGRMTIMTGYAGVYDLSGNVSEWEDSCGGNSGQFDYCHVRGGGFTDSGYALTCNEGFGITRSYAAESLGFRCCLL